MKIKLRDVGDQNLVLRDMNDRIDQAGTQSESAEVFVTPIDTNKEPEYSKTPNEILARMTQETEKFESILNGYKVKAEEMKVHMTQETANYESKKAQLKSHIEAMINGQLETMSKINGHLDNMNKAIKEVEKKLDEAVKKADNANSAIDEVDAKMKSVLKPFIKES